MRPAHAGGSDPRIEIGDEFLGQHGLEPFDEHSGCHERGNAPLDGSDGHGICLAKMIARHGHQSRDRSRGRHFLKLLVGHLLRSSPPCLPFADDT
jgi:hypothetical protein